MSSELATSELVGYGLFPALTIGAVLLTIAARRVASRRRASAALRAPSEAAAWPREAFGGLSPGEAFARLRSETASELRSIRAELERTRSLASLRTRVASHQDAIYRALQQVGSVADAFARVAPDDSTRMLNSERAVYANLRAIRIHLRALGVLNPGQYRAPEAIESAIDDVWIQWAELTKEFACVDREFRDEHPFEKDFNESDYARLWLNFYGSVGQLESLLLQLPAAEVTHRQSAVYRFPDDSASLTQPAPVTQ